MADAPRSVLCLRQEVQNYLRACEGLISEAVMPDTVPLSEDELQVVKYYLVEVADTIAAKPEKAA